MNSKRTASKQSESDVFSARDNLVDVQRQLEKDELSISQLTRILKTMSADAAVKMPDKEAQAHRTGQHIDCLKRALQAAVTLEFATIPPYLCSLWSIEDNLHPAAKSIREVVQEEMLHMSLVCNLLASIGEVPEIGSAVPSYPGSLPGGVHEGTDRVVVRPHQIGTGRFSVD